MRPILLIILVLLAIGELSAYNYIPIVKSFDKNVYNAGRQNWDIDLDSHGIVYFGNTEGLLRNIFGVWRLSKTTNHDVIRSLLVDNDTIWCGGDVDFGYFVKNSSENLTYVHKGSVDGGSVWNIQSLGEHIYYQTERTISMHHKQTDEVKSIEFGNGFYGITVWNNELWAASRNGHIGFIRDNEFVSEYEFSELNDVEVRKVFVRNNKLFLLFFDGEIISFDGREMKNETLPKSIQGKAFFTAESYDKDSYCIGTISNGLIQINEENNSILAQVNSENNLIDNTVLSIKKTSNGNVWLGLDYGIAFVELKNYLKPIFNKGATYFIKDLNQTTYLATNKGLFSSKEDEDFNLVKGSEGQVWRIRVINDELYVCHNIGLMQFQNGKLERTFSLNGVMDVAQFPGTDYFMISAYSGLLLATKKNNGFEVIENLNYWGNPKLAIDTENNCIWCDTRWGTTASFKLDRLNRVEKREFEQIESFFHFDDKFIFYDGNQLLEIDKNFSFTPIKYAPFSEIKGAGITALYSNKGNNLTAYIQNGSPGLLADLHDGSYYSYQKMLSSVKSSLMENDVFIDIVEDELRLATVRGVTTFNIKTNGVQDIDAHPVISKIDVIEDESLVTSYTFPYVDEPINLDAGEKNIIFYFGANKSTSDVVEFRHLLWPYDKDWSKWASTPNTKEYTRLKGGKYKFTVQSRLNGKVIKEHEISLSIDSYWYQTSWVIVPYALLFLACIMLTVYIMNARSKKRIIIQNKQHEKEVTQSNLKLKNKQLLEYAEVISHKNAFLLELKNGLAKMRNSESTRWQSKILEEVNNEKRNYFFHKLFSDLHQDFISRLIEQHPGLTSNDVRILSFIRINLENKEIANLMNISQKSVEVSRYRLRKKLGLQHETDLNQYILEL